MSICLATKAVHIELVNDLSTEGFLNALRRFVSRRGNIKEIYSDNATNFVGSNRELSEIKSILDNKDKLISTLNNQVIKWHFIPPRSPNFGGIWEVNIKAVKYHLKRVIGDSLLTFEEMLTVLTRIEACLDSRPLTFLSNDPNDLSVLTPGHFSIGEALTAPIEHDVINQKVNRLARWQLLEQMRQHFWNRWKKEYVLQLQVRSKWKTSAKTKLQVGDLVLISENTPPLQWPLGRVHQLHPGSDGIVRVVTVKTNNGLFKRGLCKICPLPSDE